MLILPFILVQIVSSIAVPESMIHTAGENTFLAGLLVRECEIRQTENHMTPKYIHVAASYDGHRVLDLNPEIPQQRPCL